MLYSNRFGIHIVRSAGGHPSFAIFGFDFISKPVRFPSIFHLPTKHRHSNTHTHTLSLTSPIFKWTRTGFSMLLGFHYVEAASEKLIKLLINRFCVKHKYELRRFFSLSLSFHSCYSTPAEYGKRSKNLGSFFLQIS